MRWVPIDIPIEPLDPEALQSRRQTRLVLVIRVLFGVVSVSVPLLLVGLLVPGSDTWTLGLNVVGLLGLLGFYGMALHLARRGRFDRARATLFVAWLAYLGGFLASYDPSIAPDGSDTVVLGVSSAFASLAVMGIVALEHPRRTGRWLAAVIVILLVAGALPALRPRDGHDVKLWLAALGACVMLVGAGAVFARAFASDLYASIVHSEIAMRNAMSASEAKSRFLANMSHELRTPLTGIIGMVELLRECSAEGEYDDMDDDLAMVWSSAVHLTGIIGDVLDLSKIEAGQFVLAFGPVDLGMVIEQVAAASRPLAMEGHNELVVEVRDLPLGFVSDVGRLRQVLLNLMSNAAKFTRDGRIGLRAHPSGAGVAFEVWDTGIGIPADKLESVFRPFEQVDGSSTRRHEGTGLGLAISRQIVAMLGGRLTVESELGRGATFRFVLPTSRDRVSFPALQKVDAT